MSAEQQEHTTLQSFIEVVTSVATCEVLGVNDAAAARFIAAMPPAVGVPVLVVCATLEQARQLVEQLRFFSPAAAGVHLFPHWEMAPYEPLTPHAEVEARRLATLHAISSGDCTVVVTTPSALQQRVMPRATLDALSTALICEDEYPRPQLELRLHQLGYHKVTLVEDRGTYALRGDILDIFPPGSDEPVRIDFFGDYIERMRHFDPLSQRSSDEEMAQLALIPAREMVLAGAALEQFCHNLKQRCDELGLPRSKREAVLEEVNEGLLSPGRSFLLPLNYSRLDTLFDYLGQLRLVMLDPAAIEQRMDSFANEIQQGAERMAASGEVFAEPNTLYLATAELEAQLARPGRVEFSSLHVYEMDGDKTVLRINCHGNATFSAGGDGNHIARLAQQLEQWRQDQWRVALVCRHQGRARQLADLLDRHNCQLPLPPQHSWSNRQGIAVCIGDIGSGFQLPDEKTAVISAEEVFGRRSRRSSSKTELRAKLSLSSLAQLKENDYVVHTEHGIGRYLGLQQLDTAGIRGDFMLIEYAGGDRLYLPVERIEKVQKYSGGAATSVRLDKMGGSAWQKTCQKARAAVEEMARELLTIYARRRMQKAQPFSAPDEVFRQFEAEFPYEETPDQLAAINDVLTDMQSDRPMDRLICGDVGYGKTEVAIRAAFKAALDSRQVAVIVPTTILARQHFATFAQRFANYPVTVEMVSRFRTAAEQKQILARLAAGEVDIIIGTHRLLQRDVRFKDLGLVIIDEEQRFGVRHKERLKKMRAQVAMLTLSATPIPRTLNMGMIGMRDLSIIDTAPVDRLAIRTYVTRFDDELIRAAILRELQRGGQVYFVHNRVQSINAMAEQLRTLVPEAKIAVGHGQMGEKELEEVMLSFIDGETNLLVASTIIENGLDIPRANTIIINRADCFGLAQLYQLRGRVGRSRERGYAYLLIPGESSLSKDARARLKVLQELTELGSGFRIASYDLELRGAGDLLGKKQAGQIAAIGFEMYAELLEETIQELKGQDKLGRIDPEIRLGLSAYLPEQYMADPNQRLIFYKKLAAAESDNQLYDVVDELQDRYGALPAAAEVLLEMMKLRVMMKKLRILTAEYSGGKLYLGFDAATTVAPEKLLALLQQQPQVYALSPDYILSVKMKRDEDMQFVQQIKKQLHLFY